MKSPRGLLLEQCKYCVDELSIVFVSILNEGTGHRLRFDTGIGMLSHIATRHPELIGLPSIAEQRRQAGFNRYRQALERELYLRRN
jgi:hypothetical protein